MVPSTHPLDVLGLPLEIPSVGLSQELVLLCGDPYCLLPCAEWHLPPASATELPVAHGLPWEQVSRIVVGMEHWLSRLGPSTGKGLGDCMGCLGRLEALGWVGQRWHCVWRKLQSSEQHS